MDAFIAKYAKKYGLDPVELQKVTQKMTLQQQNMAEEVVEWVEEQTRAILELAGEPEIDIRAVERTKAIESLQDHWWVQLKSGSGWLSLDPTFPQAKMGTVLARDEACYSSTGLEEKDRHRLTIRLIIEKWTNGEAEEKQVLEKTIRPSEIIGERILLTHRPLNWTPERIESGVTQDELLKAVLLQETEWLPILSIGSEEYTQFSFSDAGEVNKTPSSKRKVHPDNSVRVQEPWGGLSGLLAGRDKLPESQLTAQWIEYVIHVPGHDTRTIRSQIFDLMGPSERQREAAPLKLDEKKSLLRGTTLLTHHTKILPLVCGMSSEFVSYRFAESLAQNKRFWFDSMGRPLHEAAGQLAELSNKLRPEPDELYILAVARHKLGKQVGVYNGRLNVLSSHVQLIPEQQEGTSLLKWGIDIVDNEVAVSNLHAGLAYRRKVWHGVLDSNLETFVLPKLGTRRISTAALHASSISSGIQWVPIRSIHDPNWNRLQVSKSVEHYIKEDIKDGYIIIVPHRLKGYLDEELLGWWRVDVNTGSTMGRLAPGAGASLSEVLISLGIALSPVGLALFCDAVDWRRSICHPCAIMLLAGAIALFSFAAAAAATGGGGNVIFFLFEVSPMVPLIFGIVDGILFVFDAFECAKRL
jgi:hypothetical protein